MSDQLSPKKRNHKAIIVCGPTASGKTALTADLARRFGGELVAADSRQVYKNLDVVTGKDRPEGVKVWGYDLVEPYQEWSVSQFVQSANLWLTDCWNRNVLPIVVGGTGLYIKSLVEPIDTVLVPRDSALRQRLETLPLEKLQEELRTIDTFKWESMNHSDQMNPRRLIRAIEVVESKSLSVGKVNPPLEDVDVLWIGLNPTIEQLKENIIQRVQKRFGMDWNKELEEVQTISEKSPAISALGYDILAEYKMGKISAKELLDKWVIADLAYAKRQMVWFKKQSQITWFDPLDQSAIVEAVTGWYSKA